MNDKQHHQTQGEKRLYDKPVLIRVPLRPDEAVLGHCKTTGASTTGPGNSNCHNPANCYSLGS